MPDHDIDILTVDYRALTPRRKEAFRWLMIRRAEAARRELVRSALRAVWSGLRCLGTACADIGARTWAAYQTWRQQRIAAAELRGLDDRMLLDLGISRSEIVSLVSNDGRDTSPRRDVPPPPAARAA